MAVKLDREDDLQQLLTWLKCHQPASLKIYREMRWFLEGKFTQLDFFVDNWPHPQVAACTVSQARSQLPSKAFYVNQFIGMYGTTEKAVADFLSTCDCVDWNKEVFFNDVADAVWLGVEAVLGTIQKFPCYMLRATPEDLKPLPVPEQMKLTPISDKSIDIVHATWKFSVMPLSKLYITDIIHMEPSIMMTTDDGRHVGHMLGYPGGIIGMLFILPEFRGKGYAKVIISHLAQQLFDMGEEEVFLFVQENNKASLNLHTSVGFKVVKDAQQLGWISVKPPTI